MKIKAIIDIYGDFNEEDLSVEEVEVIVNEIVSVGCSSYHLEGNVEIIDILKEDNNES